MASAGTSGAELGIRIVLALIILVLIGVLYYVTVVPAQVAEARAAETALVRERMSDVRTALLTYRDSTNRYPLSLDSLVLFARSDSAFQAQIAAQESRLRPVSIDSLPYSPRTGARFNYEVVEDTTGLQIYWLADPDQHPPVTRLRPLARRALAVERPPLRPRDRHREHEALALDRDQPRARVCPAESHGLAARPLGEHAQRDAVL